MNQNALDALAVLSVILQLQNNDMEKQSIKNEDLFEELQRQNKEYLERIIEYQKEILAKLG